MSWSVRKYARTIPEGPGRVCYVDLPEGAEILHVHIGRVCYDTVCTLWARVDAEQPFVGRAFCIVATGEGAPLPSRGVHVASVEGEYAVMYHVFEVSTT